ncbi:hypothetical protein KCV01_g16035, partial [Aureobasidium melanogenum]
GPPLSRCTHRNAYPGLSRDRTAVNDDATPEIQYATGVVDNGNAIHSTVDDGSACDLHGSRRHHDANARRA